MRSRTACTRFSRTTPLVHDPCWDGTVSGRNCMHTHMSCGACTRRVGKVAQAPTHQEPSRHDTTWPADSDGRPVHITRRHG